MADALQWAGLLQQPPGPMDVPNAATTGAESGYKLGQMGAMVHALQGVDVNNQQSVNGGINALVHANAIDQANALIGLSRSRALLAFTQDKLTGQGSSQPQQQPDAQQPGPTVSLNGQDVDQGAAAQHVQKIDQALDQVSALPYDQRKAAVAQLAPGLGFDPQAAAGFDPTDENLANMKHAVAAHADHIGGTVQDMPPDLYTPSDLMTMSLMSGDPDKMKGAYLTAHPDMADVPGLPGVIYNKRTGATQRIVPQDVMARAAALMSEANTAGTNRANITQAPALNAAEAQKQAEIKAATLPYNLAQAGGEADIGARHDVIQVPEIGPDGQPTGKINTYRKDVALNAGSGGRPIGATRAPEDQETATLDHKLFMDNYTEATKPGAMQGDVTARDNAMAGARMAQTLNPSNLTPHIADISNTLQGLGIKLPKNLNANDLSIYQRLAAKNLTDAVTVFPKTQSEFHAIGDVVANAKSPGDAAAVAFTSAAVVKDQQLQQKQFRQQWAARNPGDNSEKNFQKAWNMQPQANQSPFASPLWQGIHINGQPAVSVKNGVAVFMPGTPQAKPFLINGR